MRRTRVKIAVVHERADTPCWPHINFDAEKELRRILVPLREENPDTDFDVVYYTENDEPQKDYAHDLRAYDGVLVLLMCCGKTIDRFYARQSKDGLPVIIAAVPYCGDGTLLMRTSPVVREENLPVPILSTTDYTQIAQAARIFDVLAKMKQTTVLVITNDVSGRQDDADGFEAVWGCRFILKPSACVNEAMEQVDSSEAQEIADRWIGEAEEVREVSREEIVESARLHLALRALMQEFSADAVTVDCLTLSYGGAYASGAHMYPCLSHYEMLNSGTVAVCEADISATVTSLLVQYLTGRPGYVSDPVVDTSCDQIVYAHCVSCTKIYGCHDRRTCRYAIRTHAEDRKGASVQTYFPAGEALTTCMVYPQYASVHSSKSVGNVGREEACRSKLAAKANAQAILENWTGSWHRVTVFGEYRKLLMDLFKIKGLRIVQEDQ